MKWKYLLTDKTKKLFIILLILLILSSCSKKEDNTINKQSETNSIKDTEERKLEDTKNLKSTSLDTEDGNFAVVDGKLSYEGKKLKLDKSYYKLSGAFGNIRELEDIAIMFGTEDNITNEKDSLLHEVFKNLNFWNFSRFLSEAQYDLLKKIDDNTAIYRVKGSDEEYMKINTWGDKNQHYLLVIGKDLKEVEEKFYEILN